MRILLCNWKDGAHPRAGGAEVWTHGIAEAWAADGHDVTLACSTAPGLGERDERGGVVIRRGGEFRTGVHAHARRVFASQRGRFDLVFDEINTRPFLAPRWAGEARVVAFIHQLAREVWFREAPLPVAIAGRFLLEPAWLRAYRTTRVGALSQSTAESLRVHGVHDVFVPPVAADLPSAPPASVEKNTRPTFVFVGRLCRMKRPFDAVRAFRRVQHDVPDAQLYIVGDGPLLRDVRKCAGRGLHVTGLVTRAERDALMRSAHALVVTSVREGWGLVVSEAAAQGTGTVAYAVPGLTDSVPATGGVLVPPRVDRLAQTLTTIARDPAVAPVPRATGTAPFVDVARALLAEAPAEAVSRA